MTLYLQTISPQDIRSLDEIKNKLNELLQYYKRIWTFDHYTKDFHIRNLYEDLDYLIYKRFGIPIKHIHSNGTLYKTLDQNLLGDQYYDDIYEDFKSSTFMGGSKNIKDFIAQNKIFDKAKVNINYQKVNITGLSSKNLIYIYTDLSLIKYLKLKVNTILSILIYNIGYIFYSIQDTLLANNRNNLLLKGMNDVYKGKISPKNAILYINDSLNYPSIKSKTVIGIQLSVIRNLQNSLTLTTDPATTFVNRFGLGNEWNKALKDTEGNLI